MSKYNVILPFAGYVNVEVEADSEEDAIEEAQSSASLNIENGNHETDLREWEFYDKLIEGNFCYVSEYEASAELIGGEES